MPKATQNLGREPDFWLSMSSSSAHHFGFCFLSNAMPSFFREESTLKSVLHSLPPSSLLPKWVSGWLPWATISDGHLEGPTAQGI